jgi:mono/diheme cytochrome c family protein
MPAYPSDAISDEAVAEMYAYLMPDTPPSQFTGRVDVGAELYRNTGCFQCHSNEAQGGAQGPRLGPNPISFPRFIWYVRNPSGSMPTYTDSVMSDQDLADVYAFLEARAQPPEVSSIPLLAP